MRLIYVKWFAFLITRPIQWTFRCLYEEAGVCSWTAQRKLTEILCYEQRQRGWKYITLQLTLLGILTWSESTAWPCGLHRSGFNRHSVHYTISKIIITILLSHNCLNGVKKKSCKNMSISICKIFLGTVIKLTLM